MKNIYVWIASLNLMVTLTNGEYKSAIAGKKLPGIPSRFKIFCRANARAALSFSE
jgi:hypothetical protein